jgi:hypothetical protein
MSQRLREVLQNCSEGNELICTDVDSRNSTYLTENKSYTVTVDDDGGLCIMDDDGDALDDVHSLFTKVTIGASPSTQGNVSLTGELSDVLPKCSAGDLLECTSAFSTLFTQGNLYIVRKGTGSRHGKMCIFDDKGCEISGAFSEFKKVQQGSIQYAKSSPYGAPKPVAVMSGKSPQLAPWEEATESNDEKDKPRSIVDGDYSQYCTWDVEDPETKTSEWKPDTIREDVDIMESIRHACNRT